jgi:hypothetical protein
MRRMPPVAAKLGADQSLVGGVTQVTRTDYNVTYTLPTYAYRVADAAKFGIRPLANIRSARALNGLQEIARHKRCGGDSITKSLECTIHRLRFRIIACAI